MQAEVSQIPCNGGDTGDTGIAAARWAPWPSCLLSTTTGYQGLEVVVPEDKTGESAGVRCCRFWQQAIKEFP